jgi:hypothetical protein
MMFLTRLCFVLTKKKESPCNYPFITAYKLKHVLKISVIGFPDGTEQ